MDKTNSRSRGHAGQGSKASVSEQSADSSDVAVKNSGAGPGSAAPPAGASAGAQPKVGSEHMTNEPLPLAGTSQSLPRTLNDTLLDERNDVLSVINELEDQLDRYEETRQSLEHDLAGKNEQLQASNQRVQELEWQVMTLQTRVDALEQVRQDVNLLEEELADANKCAQRLSEQCKRSEQENARVNSELKTANKQLEELWMVRKERDGLRADLRNLRGKIEQIDQANREMTEERAQLQQRLHETLTSLDQTRNAQHQLEHDLRAADDHNRELQRVQEAVQEKLESLRDERKSLQAQAAHLDRENARLVEQQRFCECELTSLRHVNRNAEAALSNVKKAFAEVRVALSETKSRIRRRTIENWPRINRGLRGIAAVGGDRGPGLGDGETMAASPSNEEALAAAGLGSTDNSGIDDKTSI